MGAPGISPLHPRRSHPHLRRQTNHLPCTPLSLPASQLFFLLFSASCYPAAKNNQEFTALDLELSPAQLSPLRAVSAEPGLSPGFPCLGCESIGMLRAGHVEGLRCTTQAPCVIPRTSWFFFFLLFVLLSHVFSSDASFADVHSVYLEKFPSFVVFFFFFIFFPTPLGNAGNSQSLRRCL